MQFLQEMLPTIAEFYDVQKRFSDVEGFLHDLEGYTLMKLAAYGGGVGSIVEIGSFQGRSTCFLAAGSKAVGREKVVAVDHFHGSEEHQVGQAYASKVLAEEGTTFRRFQDNLRRHRLDDHVLPIIAASGEAAERWKGPIRLLFIDGDHSYESSKLDFDLWSRFVVPHGLICFHDVPNWPGVTRLFEEISAADSGYRPLAGVVSLRILEKIR